MLVLQAFLLAMLAIGCSNGAGPGGEPVGTTSAASKTVTLKSIAVTPTPDTLYVGNTLALTATGTNNDGSPATLTNLTWASSDTTVATVDQSGNVTAISNGSASITATSGTVKGKAAIKVSVTLMSLAVTPGTTNLAANTTQALVATGTYNNNATKNLTTTVTWSSGNTAVATVSTAGLVTAVGPGSTTITATTTASAAAPVTATATINVSAATVTSVAVTPATKKLAKGTTAQFTATATFSDGSTQTLSPAVVTWTSGSTSIATVSSSGLATAVALGSTTITATHTASGVSGSASLTVTAATLKSVAVTPASPTVIAGMTQQFAATGTYSDSSTQDLTSSVTWASGTTTVGTVSSTGLATGVAAGSTTITATDPKTSKSGTATLNVTAAVLQSIALSPSPASTPAGTSVQLTATGTLNNGTTENVTSLVTWSSSATSVATVSNASGSQGLVTGLTAGPVAITATDPTTGVTQWETVQITAALLTGITVGPSTALPLGTTAQLAAQGSYSDGSTQDLTQVATWTSSAPGILVSNAAGSNGQVTAVSVGPATVTAAYGGFSGSTTVTATAAVLRSINVSPVNNTLPLGATRSLLATGVYSDGTTQNLTVSSTWSSSSGAVSVSNAAGSNGVITALAIGSATITATDPATSIAGTANVVVPTCNAGFTACGAACVNEQSDPNNCGACGSVCTTTDPNASGASCTAGTCAVACDAGYTLCNGVCVNETSDSNNCGACGNVCSAGPCMGGMCPPPATCLTAPSGIVAWWTGDGNTDDLLGESPGVPSGNVTYVAGMVGQAMQFDGVSSYVQFKSPNIPVGGADRTIELWGQFTTNYTSAAVQGLFFGYGEWGTLDATNEMLVLGTSQPNVPVFSQWGSNIADPSPVPTNTWFHYAYTLAGGVSTLYVNGTAVASSSTLTVNTPAGYPIGYMGGIPGYQEWLQGAVDEVTVYSRALQPSEIGAIYAAAGNGKCKNSGDCPSGGTFCGDTCTSVQTDGNNCGACGVVCPAGDVCTAGSCVLAPPKCTPPQAYCGTGTTCTDISSDPNNCGTCGEVCTPGDTCQNGACIPPGGQPCQSPSILCNGTCTLITTDPMNCGGCGNACPTGDQCSYSTCSALPACGTGQTLCGNECTNTQTDPTNCGKCGFTCGSGQVCATGMCTGGGGGSSCPTGETSCEGACTSLESDPLNCGSCGATCTGAACSGGTCVPCTPPTVPCGATCANWQIDPNNCGACGNMCPAGYGCTQGQCVPGADGGTGSCLLPNTLCAGVCTNLQSDPANCGLCGAVCSAGATCTAGTCGVGSGGGCPLEADVLCPMGCTDIQTDPNNCGTCGNVCASGSCAGGVCAPAVGGGSSSSDGGTTCGAAQTSCNGTCTTLSSDPMNCGTCGNQCVAGVTCQAGMCTGGQGTCPAPSTYCAGPPTAGCFDLQTDPNNCGLCGIICPPETACAAGTCSGTGSGGGANDAGTPLPDASGAPPSCGPMTPTACPNGCTNTSWDPNNCGACGMVCPAGTTCVGSACIAPQGPPCPASLLQCGATCVNWEVDSNNCGACGTTCPATSPCFAGICGGASTSGGGGTGGGSDGGTSCGSGQTLCNGACTSVQSDPNNCGACGITCPSGICQGSTCAPITSCPPPAELCEGACSNPESDPNNCHFCGNVCPPTDTCSAGACVPSNLVGGCPPPESLCGDTCSTLTNDPMNCGTCGNVCPSGTTCSNSICSAAAAPPPTTGLLPLPPSATQFGWQSQQTSFTNGGTTCTGRVTVAVSDHAVCYENAQDQLVCAGFTYQTNYGSQFVPVGMNGVDQVMLSSTVNGATGNAACVHTTTNQVLCFGNRNSWGQFGGGNTSPAVSWVPWGAGPYAHVATGTWDQMCAVDPTGATFCSGYDFEPTPEPVPGPIATSLWVNEFGTPLIDDTSTFRASDGYTTCTVTANGLQCPGVTFGTPGTVVSGGQVNEVGGPGTSACWNDSSGNGYCATQASAGAPITTTASYPGVGMLYVATNLYTADVCAVLADGSLWCFGSNTYGELGTGNTNPLTTATQVQPPGSVYIGCSGGGSTTCAAGQTSCGGTCTSTQIDPNNCGGCGIACASGICTAGICQGGVGNPAACPATGLLCGAVCTDTQVDPSNCGTCGFTCPAGATCSSGQCAPDAVACPPGFIPAPSDPYNCGGCGIVCASGVCNTGVCQPVAPTPCGAVLCGDGFTCSAGVCVPSLVAPTCPAGSATCAGFPTCGTILTTDPNNCGACGNACASGICTGGICQAPQPPACASPETTCGAVCTSLQDDPMNCGSCGFSCPLGATCFDGACTGGGFPCPSGFTPSPDDPNNCGGCGIVCASGQCDAGVCAPVPLEPCGAVLCGEGSMCSAGVCVPSPEAPPCPAGEATCPPDAACTTILGTDSNNCGACGNVCPLGDECQNGICTVVACPLPMATCPGEPECGTDLQTDPNNCGACGVTCPSGTCSAGVCTPVDTCVAPQELCGTVCTDTSSDPDNCGFCGDACIAGDTCSFGACVPPGVGGGTCPGGEDLCNGTCTTLMTDPNNCGTCGNVCIPGDTCSTGVCTPGAGGPGGPGGPTCATGWTNCNNAYCTIIATDPNNCGGCGIVCPSGVCNNGLCQ